MIAQNRPDIANVAEQTVLALKELEGRIGVLKGEVANLCQGLGHTEAARIAAAPSPGPGPGAWTSSPYSVLAPTAFALTGGNPWMASGPWNHSGAPSPMGGWNGYVPQAFAATGPYPWPQAYHAGAWPQAYTGVSPQAFHAGAWPQSFPHAHGWPQGSPFASYAASPFTAVPAGYR